VSIPINITELGALVDRIEADGILVAVKGLTPGIHVSQVTDDSRTLQRAGLFVAVEGEVADGHRFIPEAIGAGAAAVICETLPESFPTEIPIILVTNARRALGLVAHAFWCDPSDKFRLIGVTGTNGKTTTSWLVHHMLTEMGRTAGLVGTIETKIGRSMHPASLTTPVATELNRTLSDMVVAGCSEVAMEVSSHALAQDRTAGLQFSVGVFTNLTREHLDYHGSWTSYLDAKAKLFSDLDPSATAIVNSDDEAAVQMVSSTAAKCASFGSHGAPTHRFKIIENKADGISVNIDGDTRRYRLVGDFNAYNITAAYSIGVALGFPGSTVLDALETASPVPGRLEQFNFESGVSVIVDFAHTPDALEKALTATKDIAPAGSTLWCIFGCGGDRDPGKRPEMGFIAEAIADRVIVTSDNPRTEAPEAILDDIRDGMEQPDRAEWIVDRRDAIRFAGCSAASGDIVLVAGKGHEPDQVIGTDRIHLDDREEVRRWFG
jgi:UDP-N-acetylmuramoyl-L-alanyl-D-glutamate--2,6-diaminopimelate ligase